MGLLDKLFGGKAAATPADEVAALEGKLRELHDRKNALASQMNDLDDAAGRAAIDAAIVQDRASKDTFSAAQRALHDARADQVAIDLAVEAIEAELPDARRRKADAEKASASEARKADAASRLKKLPAAMKTIDKILAEVRKAAADLRAIDGRLAAHLRVSIVAVTRGEVLPALDADIEDELRRGAASDFRSSESIRNAAHTAAVREREAAERAERNAIARADRARQPLRVWDGEAREWVPAGEVGRVQHDEAA
jgi:predicted  nucleic acid-binding Zn-ribbon protein